MMLSNFELMLMKGILIIIVVVIGYFVFNRSRTFARGTSGKKMSFNRRTKPFSASIDLFKSSRFNPAYIQMVVTNTGTREIDLHAPVLIFKRWFTKRKFRVREQVTAENGEIVVAGIPGEEATVKFLQRNGATIVLQPANASYAPMEFRSDEITIFGKVVTVIRSL